MSVAVDSSVLVAALLVWHDEHAVCAAALDAAVAAGEIVVPAHALVEAYSVMTRLPSPHRVRAGDALEALQGSLQGVSRLVGRPPRTTWRLLERFAATGIVGGTTYDGLILESALAAGAQSLLTLNPGDFRRLKREGIAIVVPE